MFWHRRLDSGLVVMHTRPEHADELEELQRVCFPTLADEERFKARHYRKHVELFADGQLVALDGERVVGATSTIRLPFDFEHVGHTFGEIIQGGWLTSHDPAGDWLYGADIGVHPDYRGRGLGAALYAARQEVVWRLGLRGQVTGGMLRGYGAVKDTVSAEDYYADVVAGRRTDPTLSMQLGVGFEPRALLKDYLNDPVSDNYSALLVLDAATDLPGASRELARRYVRLHTPGARSAGQGDARPARRGAAGRARQGHRRRRRARPRFAALRRRRQHLHRHGQRHRRHRRRPRAGGGGRRRDPPDAEVPAHLLAGHHLRADGPAGRTAERADPGRLRQEDDLRQQRRRSGRERRQARAQVHRAGRRSSASRAATTAARCSRSA